MRNLRRDQPGRGRISATLPDPATTAKPLRMFRASDNVGFWLFTTSNAYERVLTACLADLGLTSHYLRVLIWLETDEGLSQGELAERLQMDDAALGRLLKSMERDGWIHRKPAPFDRRKKLVQPMPIARRARDRLHAAVEQVEQIATTRMNASVIEQTKHVLSAIRGNLAQANSAD